MIYNTFELHQEGSLPGAHLVTYIQEYSEAMAINDRPLILLCPGGGYTRTSDREAEPMALKFLAMGYHAAVLRYSCAPAEYPTSLKELAYSIKFLREHAKEWHIDPHKIVVEGCSAGGHLAASLGVFWDEDFLAESQGLSASEHELLRPDGLLLCYPVITSGEFAHRGSFENLLGSRQEELGAEKLEQYIRDFAITESVSFDGLTSEEGDFDLTEAGILEVAWSGIGQYTDLVNPARFLTFLGAVANNGVEITPHVVEKITLGDQTTYSASAGTTTRRLSKALAKTLQEGMRGNVENNYGVSSFPEGMTVCAKTGTAQGEDGSRPNAMIAGFVLDDEYPLAFFAAVEHGGYGADVCVPLMGQVLAACKEALDKT